MNRFIAVSLLTLFSHAALAADKPIENPLSDKGSWLELREDLAGDIPLQDGNTLFNVAAPYRAHDAATVPIVIQQMSGFESPIKAARLVIDENPAPVAADFKFGAAMSPLKFEVRVRVNQYSNVRVIAETDKGNFMQGRFVKASGGCSAPASKDPEQALAQMGQMRLKHFGEVAELSNQRREAQIMIRHPNYSGLQRDQVTHLFIGAHFIDKMEVYQGDDMLFALEGGISISENPVFRFDYTDNGAPGFRVRVEDTDGNVWDQVLEKRAQS